MFRVIWAFIFIATCWATGVIAGPAPGTTAQGRDLPTTALLVDAPSGDKLGDIASLLEVGLAKSGKARLLERAAVDKLFAEQRLQKLLDAGAGADRVRVGEMLKANCLILLRHWPAGNDGGGQGEQVKIVVSETGRGLRLLNVSVEMPASGGMDVDALMRMILPQVERSIKPVSRIAAVLPFVDKNLTMDFDSMRGAYREIAEQALERDPSLAVIGVEEADEIGRELKVAGEKQLESRPPPLIVAGEFRHEGKGGETRVQLKLSARLGSREVHQFDKQVPSDQATRLITLFVQEAMEKAFGQPLPASNPANETAQLNIKADTFKRLGNWVEAFNLYNASLLVNNEQLPVHQGVVTVINRLVKDPYGGQKLSDADRVVARRRALVYWRQATEHIEWCIRHDKNLTDDIGSTETRLPYKGMILGVLFDSVGNLLNDKDPAAQADTTVAMEEVYAARRSVRDLMADSLGKFVKGRRHGMAEILIDVVNYGPSEFGEQPADAVVTAERIIRHAVAMEEIKDYAWGGYLGWARNKGKGDPKVTEAIASLITRLRADPDARLQAVGQYFQDQLDGKIVPRAKLEAAILKESHTWAAALGPGVKLERIDLSLVEGRNGEPAVAMDPWGWIAGGPGQTFVYDRATVAVLTAPNKLVALYHDHALTEKSDKHEPPTWATTDAGIQWPCFDGRRLWIPRAGPEPALIVIDPATGARHVFGAADGLFPMNRGVSSVALGEGRIMLSGGFDDKDNRPRAWIALVKIDEQNHLTVDVFHEAREMVLNWRHQGAETGFWPSRMLLLSDPTTGGQRVLLARWHREINSPLIIDPASKRVEVFSDRLGNYPLFQERPAPGIADGLLFYMSPRSWSPDGFPAQQWVSLGFPELKSKVVLEEGWIGMHARWTGTRAVALDDRGRFWMAKNMKSPFVRLAGEPMNSERLIPGIRELFVSPTLGLLLINRTTTAREILRVTPPELSDKELDDLYARQSRCIPENARVSDGRAFWALQVSCSIDEAKAEAQRRGAKLMTLANAKDVELFGLMVHQNHQPPNFWVGLRSNKTKHELPDGTAVAFDGFDDTQMEQSELGPVFGHQGWWRIGKAADRAGVMLEWKLDPVDIASTPFAAAPPTPPAPTAPAAPPSPLAPGANPTPAPPAPAPPPAPGSGLPAAPPPASPAAAPEFKIAWDDVYQKSARVKVNLVSEQLRESDDTEGWKQVPEALRRKRAIVFMQRADKYNGVVEFEVLQDGFVLLACNYDYQGNPSGDWVEQQWTRDRLIKFGWTFIPNASLGGALVKGNKREQVLFIRQAKAGEKYNLRCNKYEPPFVIVFSDQ